MALLLEGKPAFRAAFCLARVQNRNVGDQQNRLPIHDDLRNDRLIQYADLNRRFRRH